MVRVVKLNIKKDCIDHFKSIFHNKMRKIRNQQGCYYLELLEDQNEEGVFFTYSIWEDESKLKSYKSSALFGDVWPEVKQLFEAPAEAYSLDSLITVDSITSGSG